MTARNERDSVVKNLLLAAAAATMIAVSPAFASIADEAEQGIAVYPSVGPCHFVKQAVRGQDGRVTYRTVQVCN
jgi:hypothetical protein